MSSVVMPPVEGQEAVQAARRGRPEAQRVMQAAQQQVALPPFRSSLLAKLLQLVQLRPRLPRLRHPQLRRQQLPRARLRHHRRQRPAQRVSPLARRPPAVNHRPQPQALHKLPRRPLRIRPAPQRTSEPNVRQIRVRNPQARRRGSRKSSPGSGFSSTVSTCP